MGGYLFCFEILNCQRGSPAQNHTRKNQTAHPIRRFHARIFTNFPELALPRKAATIFANIAYWTQYLPPGIFAVVPPVTNIWFFIRRAVVPPAGRAGNVDLRTGTVASNAAAKIRSGEVSHPVERQRVCFDAVGEGCVRSVGGCVHI